MKFLLPSDTPHGQRDAITADDDKITVEAGAGTGKTWVLSGRYARLLLENSDLLPNNILTLTYTEAAAGEMKHRIEERLRQELEGSDDYDRKREILEGMSDSWISTIHSFAARQIRESGLSLDIDPKASVITPQQEQDFWNSVREATEFARLQALARSYRNTRLESVAKSLDGDEYFSAAVAKWGADKLSHFAASAAELHASSGRSWEDMLGWVENDTLITSARALVERITLPEWEKVWGIFSSIPPLPNPKTKGPESVGVIFNQLLESFRGRTPDKGTIYDFYAKITQAKSTGGNPFTALKEYLGGQTFAQWRDSQPQAIVEASQGFYDDFTYQELRMRKTLLKFCATAWGIWDIMKSRRGLLSFSDMILHAKRAITSGGGSRKFSHILVDEFQDTDPLQYAMINSLVDDTKFFAVGDPKQSIYKFRHADPSLFARTIRESDKRITLGVSFRTRKTLLGKINRLFSAIWADGLGQSQAMSGLKYESLDPVSDTPERNSGTMPDFRIFLAPHNS
ncbi:MAG: UvrD-helicase domain-containing protein, partial [Synergistaceae bacterium]|nr:UvrD-helicase domain-containing protein [Synergistaceae bacterium]